MKESDERYSCYWGLMQQASTWTRCDKRSSRGTRQKYTYKSVFRFDLTRKLWIQICLNYLRLLAYYLRISMKSKAQAIEQNTVKINELRDSSSSSSQDYRETPLSRGATIHRFSTSSCPELKHQKKSKNKNQNRRKKSYKTDSLLLFFRISSLTQQQTKNEMISATKIWKSD